MFSFFPTKNLGAFGDAGAIITNNLKIYKKIKMFFNHGGLKKINTSLMVLIVDLIIFRH